MKTVWRHTLPFNGVWTRFELHSLPAAVVTSPSVNFVEFWAEHDDSEPGIVVDLQMFATGQELPDDPAILYLATTPRVQGLVFHLYLRWTVGVDPA